MDELFLINDLPPWGIETPYDGKEGQHTGDVKREKVTIKCLECPPSDQRKKVAALKRSGRL